MILRPNNLIKVRPHWKTPIPMLNMGGGIRFSSTGRVFTKRGMNFVKDDGTCEDCNCDNPPGSGQNTVSCGFCTDGIMPASSLLTFVGLTYASCAPAGGSVGLIKALSKTGSGVLGSYCMPAGGCGADLFPSMDTSLNNLTSTFYSNPSCTGTIITNVAHANLYWRYGPQFGISGPLGWTVISAGITGTFGVIYFYGFAETDGDCTTAVTISNLIVAGTYYDGTSPIFVPELGWSSHAWGGSTGGSCVLTPQKKLCS